MDTSWDRLCSLELRDWSDRFSNWSFCEAADVSPGATAVTLGWRQLPAHTVALFLHEVTHHVLFDSPVGMALASLEMAARGRAARFTDASEVTEVDAVRLYELQLFNDVT